MNTRLSSSKRGYSGTNWRYWRAVVPVNDCPITGDKWTKSFHLDHVLPKSQGGKDELSNFQWLSQKGHAIKTAKYDGGYGNPVKPGKRTLPIKCGCDSNGLPLSPLHHWRDNKK